jgi:penicillin V acylase-like amidase (Ntn superfamily)
MHATNIEEKVLDQTAVYTLFLDQINAIEEAQAQFKKGQFLTDEEARKDFEEWRKK